MKYVLIGPSILIIILIIIYYPIMLAGFGSVITIYLLHNLNNKNMKPEGFNLEQGKYYYVDWKLPAKQYLFIRNKPLKGDSSINLVDEYFSKESGDFGGKTNWKEIREATFSERQWLDKCIDTNKFIPKEKALKGKKEIPEYVECIRVDNGLCSDLVRDKEKEIVGTIRKTSELPSWVRGWTLNEFWKKYIHYYKSSTKEAFDQQNKPKEPEMNTYGLKVGDRLRNDVISEWGRANSNENIGNGWQKASLTNYAGERAVEKFKDFNGVLGFLVSGTASYLKAEGFKEFMENFDKPKSVELTSLPEKWKLVTIFGNMPFKNHKDEIVIVPSKEFANNMIKEIGGALEPELI